LERGRWCLGFSPNGRSSLIIMQADLPKLSSNDAMKPTADEAEAIVRGSIAYFGTYEVDEADGRPVI
jgi:hypothetical protein